MASDIDNTKNNHKKINSSDDEPSQAMTEDIEGDDDRVVTLNAGSEQIQDDDSAAVEEDIKAREQHERSLRRPTNAREVITQFVPNRSERADEKLRSHLVGKIEISVDGTNDNYIFEWLSGRAVVKEEKATAADCSIRVSEQNLMRVVAGELNPQLAMLSGKIQVNGNAEAAIYFFNLVAPRSHH